MPSFLDETNIQLPLRGNKPRAPPRGAVPMKAEAKDALILELKRKIRKLECQDQVPVVPAVTRRVRGKMSPADIKVCLPKTNRPQQTRSDAVLNIRLLYHCTPAGGFARDGPRSIRFVS